MQRRLVLPAFVLAAILLALALVYLAFPANALPGFIPGHDPTLARHHPMRAAEIGLVALALALYGWVQLEVPARRTLRRGR